MASYNRKMISYIVLMGGIFETFQKDNAENS